MKYGLNVTGKIRVFTKTKTIQGQNKKTYEITDVWFNISEQNEDNTYFNLSTNLIFKKDLPKPENNTVILIEGFPMITGNGKFRKVAYYVNNWSAEEDEKSK